MSWAGVCMDSEHSPRKITKIRMEMPGISMLRAQIVPYIYRAYAE